MAYKIRMGVPGMKALWDGLQQKHRNGTISKTEDALYHKWGKALKLLAANPSYPSLKTHDIEPLTKRYGIKVWQSYLENKNSDAMRMFWSHILRIRRRAPTTESNYLNSTKNEKLNNQINDRSISE